MIALRSCDPPRTSWATVLGLILATSASAFAQFPDAPRDPLPPLPERRETVLKEFDKNADGRLDGTERESARKAWAAKQLAQRGERNFFRPPPELLEEFDTNKDGELDEEEGRILGETMGRRFEKMRKDYDRNNNNRLDEDEIAAAAKDIDDGKLKGIPKMFLQFAGGDRRRGGRPGGPPPGGDMDPQTAMGAADRDGDGRLSATELQTLRSEWARRRGAAEKENPDGAQRPEGQPQP